MPTHALRDVYGLLGLHRCRESKQSPTTHPYCGQFQLKQLLTVLIHCTVCIRSPNLSSCVCGLVCSGVTSSEERLTASRPPREPPIAPTRRHRHRRDETEPQQHYWDAGGRQRSRSSD
jgi:hypothetical protein